jgi:hypothetical protein
MYAEKPQALEELKDRIKHAINNIPLASIQMVCRSVRHHSWSALWQKMDVLNM